MLLFFFHLFELYVNSLLFKHRHSLTCDVLICAKAQHSFFMAPIQGHGEMQGHPNFPAMLGTFQWTFHMFWKQFLWNNICFISVWCVHVCRHSTIHSLGKILGRCNMPNCFTSIQLVIYKVCKMLCFQHCCQHIDFFARLGYCFFCHLLNSMSITLYLGIAII